MPTPDLIQGVPLPTYDDPAAIPDDLASIFYALLQRGIPRFSTTAQRDAAYPSPVDGQHCWIAGENAVYVRSGGAWMRLAAQPTAWTSQGVTIGSGQSAAITPEYRVTPAGRVEWRGSIFGPAPTQDAVLLTFPAAIAPTVRRTAPLTSLNGAIAIAYIGAFGGVGSTTTLQYRAMATGSWPGSAVFGIDLAGVSWALD